MIESGEERRPPYHSLEIRGHIRSPPLREQTNIFWTTKITISRRFVNRWGKKSCHPSMNIDDSNFHIAKLSQNATDYVLDFCNVECWGWFSPTQSAGSREWDEGLARQRVPAVNKKTRAV